MGAVSTVPAFLTALRTALGTATGVAVYSAPVDAALMGEASVILATENVVAEYEYETMPRTQVHEAYAVDGFIWISKPGAGETAIAAARDRAYAILEAVHDYVAGLVGKTETQAALGVDHVKVTGHSLEQFASDAERHVFLRFTIEADAYFDPA
jgi:hypothetical protein